MLKHFGKELGYRGIFLEKKKRGGEAGFPQLSLRGAKEKKQSSFGKFVPGEVKG